ncbi:MAG: hypothetical protein HYU77_02785 [Betaproteobacteria bacterium]|nr:hypothetical protein [Betaproteobacteria bacterium]
MQQWLTDPVFQSAVAPFVAALIVAELLQRLRLSGLALTAGFCTTVYLVADFSFAPLTSTRKIVYLSLGAAALGLLFDLLLRQWRPLRYLLAIAVGAAMVWVVWNPLSQKDTVELALYGFGLFAFAAWIAAVTDGLREAPQRAGCAGLALGLGTGLSALLGASALLGQLGLGLGAASGAYLLIQMISGGTLPAGRILTLPLAVASALIAGAAMMLAKLPWQVLPVLACVPLGALVPVPGRWALWVQIFLLSLCALAVAAVAAFITWQMAGGLPL